MPVPKGHKGPLELVAKATDESYNTQVRGVLPWAPLPSLLPCSLHASSPCVHPPHHLSPSASWAFTYRVSPPSSAPARGGGAHLEPAPCAIYWHTLPACNAACPAPCAAARGGGAHLEPARRELQLLAPRHRQRGVMAVPRAG